MKYNLRQAVPSDGVKLAKMLRISLKRGIEGRFNIDPLRLLNHVTDTIQNANGFALVLEHEGQPVGCYMAELVRHAYCKGYVVQELGVFINAEHRGDLNFVKMLDAYLAWADSKPDVLFKTFTIGQLGATTPYLRAVLKKRGFTQGDEGYYKL